MSFSRTVGLGLICAVCMAASPAFGNLITNGDFSGGTSGFGSDYTLALQNTGVGDEKTIGVVSNPQAWNSNFVPFTDHTTGSGQMLIANGSNDAYNRVWFQSMNVVGGTVYDVELFATSAFAASPAKLLVSVEYADLSTMNLGTLDLTGTTPGVWNSFATTYAPSSNATVKLMIRNLTTVAQGNDFAIDDISVAPVPEPTSLALLGIGSLIGLGVYTRRRRQA